MKNSNKYVNIIYNKITNRIYNKITNKIYNKYLNRIPNRVKKTNTTKYIKSVIYAVHKANNIFNVTIKIVKT